MTTKEGEFLSKRVQKQKDGEFGRNWKLVKDHEDPRKRVWHLIEINNGVEKVIRKRTGAINIGGNIITKIQRDTQKDKERREAYNKEMTEKGYYKDKRGKWKKKVNFKKNNEEKKKNDTYSKELQEKDNKLKNKYKQVSGEELKLKIKEIKEQQEKNKKKNVEKNEEKKKKVVVQENEEKKKKVVVEDNKDKDKKKVIVNEDKKDKLKVSKFIRNPKTKTLVRRTSQKGKQILKLQERIKKRNKRLFGK